MKENWTYKKLDEVCEINYGTRVVQKKDKGSTYYVYGGGGATFMVDSYNREDCFIVSRFAMSPKCTRFVKGKFFLNDSGLSVSPKVKELTQSFVDKVLLANNDTIYSFGKGMAQRNLDIHSFKNLIIPVPPIETQSRIVSELDLLQSIIDKQKAQLKELDNLAQAVFYDMFGDNNCTKKRLGEVVKVQSGLVSPLEAPYCDMIHIGPANIESHTGKLVDLKTAKEEKLISGKYLFDPSMVLYSKIRPNLNKVTIASFEGICSADMYPLKPTKELDKRFLLFILKQKDFWDYAVSNSGRANIPKINRKALLNYKIVLPPLSLQQSFAAKIESIEKQKAAIGKSIEETQKLFDYTMDKYFG